MGYRVPIIMCLLIMLGMAVGNAITGCGPRQRPEAEVPRDSTDAPTGPRSGLQVFTDHATGCQYLRVNSTAITPRLNREGKPVCEPR